MARPDSGSADQGANQDDAVWLDLVARLEADMPSGYDSPEQDGPRGGDEPAKPAAFRDFDPLNLAGMPPTEPSAAERSAPSGSSAGTDGTAQTGRTGEPDAGTVPPGPRDYDLDDDGGDFVPEEPPSLSGTDPLTMLAWLAAVGGPVALLLSAMFWRSAPLLAIVGIIAAFVLGTVYLIMKLPQEKDENDDGARV